MSVGPRGILDLATIPLEFEPWTYRSLHSDLWYLTDAELGDHYEQYGRTMGRRAHPLETREALRDLVPIASRILEIGPFFKPTFSGANVRYFDVLDRAGLIRHAADLGFVDVDVPAIDFVSPTGDLAIVDDEFDVVFSSHVIEHQPDLVTHLQQVERILSPGGVYLLFVPDNRYCFDHFLPESAIAEVIVAFIERRRFHTLRTAIQHETMGAHNDPVRHWRGDHGEQAQLGAEVIALAMESYDRATSRNEYLDFHAWQFTPRSLRSIIGLLNELGVIGLEPARVFDTLAGHNEFWALLIKRPSAGT